MGKSLNASVGPDTNVGTQAIPAQDAVRLIGSMTQALNEWGRQSEDAQLISAINLLRLRTEELMGRSHANQGNILNGAPADDHPSSIQAIEESPRDLRLKDWAERHEVPGKNAFEIQGSLISTYRGFMIEIRDTMMANEHIENMNPRMLSIGGYRILKIAARSFDPLEHGDDFLQFATVYISAGILFCSRKGELVIPDKIDNLTLLPAEFFQIVTEVNDKKERPGKQNDNARASNSDQNTYPTKKSPRSLRLEEWAKRNGVPGHKAFAIQGSIIRGHAQWISRMRDELLQNEARGSDPDMIRQGGYSILTVLAKYFDPPRDGESFLQFSKPYIHAAMLLCARRQEMAIPTRIDNIPEFLAQLISSVTSEPTLASTVVDSLTDTGIGERDLTTAPKRGFTDVDSDVLAAAPDTNDAVPVDDQRSDTTAVTDGPSVTDQTTVVIDQGTTATAEVSTQAPQGNTNEGTSAQPPTGGKQEFSLQDEIDMQKVMAEQRVIEYVQAQKEGPDVWSIEGAREFLVRTHAGAARTELHKLLKEHHKISKPKNTALTTAATELLQLAATSFEIPENGNGNGDRFRGHLHAVIKEKGHAYYQAHA